MRFDRSLYSYEPDPDKTLPDLLIDLSEARQRYGRGSSQGHAAFMRVARWYALRDRTIDELPFDNPDEVERFMAQIVTGADGHKYWAGERVMFRCNEKYTDGTRKSIAPRKFFYTLHNQVPRRYSLESSCGEAHCIAPSHQAFIPERRKREPIYSESMMLGGLQVMAMQLGRSPTTTEWKESGRQPHPAVFSQRFGSWANGIKAAGLEPNTIYHRNGKPVTRERALETMRELRRLVGRTPRYDDLRRPAVRSQLAAKGLFTTPRVILKFLGGTWGSAVQISGG